MRDLAATSRATAVAFRETYIATVLAVAADKFDLLAKAHEEDATEMAK